MAPDIRDYQQLVYGGATRSVDCSGWSGAINTDAHTRGATKLTGRAIRLASNEPVPDPESPGLNVQQVDAAIYKLTGGKVDMWTPTPGTIGRAGFRDHLIDGRWVHVAVKRGVLVDRGFGGSSGFRGSHAITVHARMTDLSPVIGDPLVPYYYAASWDAILDAAEAVTPSGLLYVSFTRDLTVDYRVSVHPDPGKRRKKFLRYFVDGDGRITGRKASYTTGFSATCTAPRMHTGSVQTRNGRVAVARELVKLTSGSRDEWWINAVYAERT